MQSSREISKRIHVQKRDPPNRTTKKSSERTNVISAAVLFSLLIHRAPPVVQFWSTRTYSGSSSSLRFGSASTKSFMYKCTQLSRCSLIPTTFLPMRRVIGKSSKARLAHTDSIRNPSVSGGAGGAAEPVEEEEDYCSSREREPSPDASPFSGEEDRRHRHGRRRRLAADEPTMSNINFGILMPRHKRGGTRWLCLHSSLD